jgi:hypothetical protein
MNAGFEDISILRNDDIHGMINDFSEYEKST